MARLHSSVSQLSLVQRFPIVFFFNLCILFLKNKFIYLFIIFGCVRSLLLHAGFLLIVASGDYSLLQCAGFSLRWLLLLRSTGSRLMGFSSYGAWALECRLGSCGVRAQLLHGMWDLPGPGLEPVSPALAGGFLTTAPLGKPLISVSFIIKHKVQHIDE